MRDPLSRRSVLRGIGGLSLLLAGCPRGRGGTGTLDARTHAPPTPAIDDDDDPMPPARGVCELTADNIEGPFYKAGAPERRTLAGARDKGERLGLGGVIRGASCTPIAAELDIWQADADGGYDMDGYRFRATLPVGEYGIWGVDTIVPGRYLNGRRYRPAHIHVKVRAPGHRELTTQLYFAGDPYNDGDPFIVPSLIMAHEVRDGVRRARFDFVLESD